MAQEDRDHVCADCRHWAVIGPVTLPGSEEREYGQCRRAPPVIVAGVEAPVVPAGPQGVWPGTLDDDWCGEWREAR
jgi:hypothetical protein